MKLAIITDWILTSGGNERVLAEVHKIFPEAPIYALFSNKKFASKLLPGIKIRTSFLQKIPHIVKLYPYFAFLMPSAVESFDLSEYDIVLSLSASFAKGVILKPKTKHICYCYSPTRFLWDQNAEYDSSRHTEGAGWLSLLARHWLRIWDRQAADRVDHFVAISNHVAERIKKYYNRDSIVIYPPVKNLLANSQQPIANSPKSSLGSELLARNYYLIVGRLYKYKNIGETIEAFNKLGYPLIIVGKGPDESRLKKMAGKNIHFAGKVNDAELAELYSKCQAVIIANEEDFGLTMVEAMQFGKPVLALRRGGALEIIKEGETGEFFDDAIPEAIADGVRRLNENYEKFSSERVKVVAEKFSEKNFETRIKALVAVNKT